MKPIKKSSKVFLTALVFALVAVLFTACSDQKTEDNQTGWENEVTEESFNETEPETPADTQSVISLPAETYAEQKTTGASEAPADPAVKNAEYYRNLPTLTATEHELEMLAKTMIFIDEYDCDSENALEQALVNLIGEYGNIGRYIEGMDYLGTYGYIPGSDPLGKFISNTAYNKYSAETVDKFLRSGYNVEPDHSFEVVGIPEEEYSSKIYYYDGYYYSACAEVGGAGPTIITDLNIADGKYYVTVSNDENIPYVNITAKLLEVDGERIWSYEKVNFLTR